MANFLLFLDPGHGGKDSGAVGTLNGTTYTEKSLNLAFALAARDYLVKHYEIKSEEIGMSRTSDSFVSLSERAKDANDGKADIFISIHCNSADNASASGFESYIFPSAGTKTKELQNLLHAKVFAVCKEYGITKDRGKKTANFQVLRETSMPAVLLEMGFINNPTELRVLINKTFQEAVGKSIAESVADYLNLKKKVTQPEAPVYRVLVNNVQVGAYRDTENILEQVELALKNKANTIDINKI